MFDHYIQRGTALIYAESTQMPNIKFAHDVCKEIIENNEYDTWMENWHEYKSSLFVSETPDKAEENCERWIEDPNKLQVASVVADNLSLYEKSICVELGCHAGTLMYLIDMEATKREICFDIIGIEPDENPLKFGRKKFPEFTIHKGSHDDMISDKIELPEKIHVLLLSYMCLLLKPEEVESIMEWASKRCECIILADDVANTDGEIAVVRRKYLLHPWKAILSRYGFHIESIEMLEEPTLAATGIIVAKKRRET